VIPNKQPKVRLPLADGGSIVLFDMLADKGQTTEEVNRNVFRLTAAGDVVWQIESGAFEGERQPFTNVYFNNDLKAYCWNGAEYPVDIETGELGPGVLVK
jgi:hypothetical protein